MLVDPSTIKNASDYLVAQGILGIAVMVLAAIIVYLWRDARQQRKDCEEKFHAERTRHATELAAERSLNKELHDLRVNELKLAISSGSELVKSYDTVISLLKERIV